MIPLTLILTIMFLLPHTYSSPSKSRPTQHRFNGEIEENISNDQGILAPDLVSYYDVIPGKKRAILEAIRVSSMSFGETISRWSSFGYPRIQLQANGEIFKFQSTYASISISTLDDDQRIALLTVAREMYPKEKLTLNSIIPLAISNFSCDLSIEAEKGETFSLKGKVLEITENPLTLKFPLKKGTPQRKILEKLNQEISAGQNNLDFLCTMQMVGKDVKASVPKKSKFYVNKLKLVEKVLGSSNESWLSKCQIKMLVNEISKILIEENYEEELKNGFIEHLMEKHEFVEIEKVADSMSKYGLSENFNLKTYLSEIFMMKNDDGRKYIQVRKTDQKKFADLEGVSVKAEVEYVKQKFNEWKQGKVSLQDQLSEINRKSEKSDGIKYKIIGDRLVPIGLLLGKLERESLENMLQLKRVTYQLSEKILTRTYELNTMEDVQRPGTFMTDQTMNTLAPKSMVTQSLGSHITTPEPLGSITAGQSYKVNQRPIPPKVIKGPKMKGSPCRPQQCQSQKRYCLRGRFVECEDVLRFALERGVKVGEAIRLCCSGFMKQEELEPGECRNGVCIQGKLFCINGRYMFCNDMGLNAESVSNGCCKPHLKIREMKKDVEKEKVKGMQAKGSRKMSGEI